MRESKRQLAYTNRRNKRNDSQMQKEKMVVAISENRMRDFFKEVKKLNLIDKTAPSIAGHVDLKQTADHLADKYDRLYNSALSDAEAMEQIAHHINNNIQHYNDKDHIVTAENIYDAILYLKSNKSDGDKELMSNHLLMSGEIFTEHLSRLFTVINTHGYQPKDILLGTITSIPKDRKGNICDGRNYRGITLCSSISKLIYIVMIMKYSGILNTSERQYAFKKDHITVMCTLVLKEVINYYLNNKSDVYTCFIDATKAFDCIMYDKLFQILIKRDVPALALRMILDLYQRQGMRTVWRGQFSRTFSVCNGI